MYFYMHKYPDFGPGMFHQRVELRRLDRLDGHGVGVVHGIPRLLGGEGVQLKRGLKRTEIYLLHYLKFNRYGGRGK